MEGALAGLVALGLAAVHVAGQYMSFLDAIPRSRWLSAAGGVAVAYVFVHVLPELSLAQRAFEERAAEGGWLAALESHSYLVALVGLSAFYGVERGVQLRSERKTRDQHPSDYEEPHSPATVFWLHLASYALYNVLVGYLLLHREEGARSGLLLFGFAMGLHFLVNDRGLHADHGRRYGRYGRWILAAAVLGGWGLGMATDVPEVWVSTFFAFLAGGVILNVLKEELPRERRSRFWAFAAGAAGYAALLLAV